MPASSATTGSGWSRITAASSPGHTRRSPAAVLRLVVDLVAEAERLPETAETALVLGVALPRLVLDPRHPREYLIREALRADVAMRTHPAALVPGGVRDV